MKKLTLILCLLLLPTLLYAGGMMLGIVGGGTPAGAPAGGILLVGNNGATVDEAGTVDPNSLWGINGTFAAAGYKSRAVATGYATKGYVVLTQDETENMKLCIYTAADNTLRATSSVKTGGTAGWVEFTFAGTYQITSGTDYHIQIIADGYIHVGIWQDPANNPENSYMASSYASPAATYAAGDYGYYVGVMYVTN